MPHPQHVPPRHSSRPSALARAIGIAGLSALLALTGCGDSGGSAEELGRALERAEAYRSQGQYRASVLEARNAVQSSPDSREAHVALARIYLELGQGRLALAELDTIKEPRDIPVQLLRARALALQGKHQSAGQLLKGLESSVPADQQVQYLRLNAESAEALGNAGEADQYYQRARKLEPGNLDLLNSMIRAALLRDDRARAEELLQEALKLSPENPETLVTQAGLFFTGGRLEDAEEALTRALAQLPKADLLTPLRARALEMMIEVITRQGRWADALVYTEVLNEANPDAAALKSKYDDAMEAYQSGDMAKAKQLLLEIEQQSPGNPYSSTMLGVVNYVEGNLDEAQRYLSTNLDPETSSPVALEILANTQLRLNQPEKVLEMMDKHPGDHTRNPELLALYGIASLQLGKEQQGLEAIHKSLELAPGKASLRLTLAHYHKSRGDEAKALEQLRAAHAAEPKNLPAARELLAQLMGMKQQAEAEALLEQLLKQNPADAGTQNLAGQFRLVLGDLPAAEKHFGEALRADAASGPARFGLANIALRQNKPDEALAQYEQVISANPGLSAAYKGVASALELKGEAEGVPARLEALAAAHAKKAAPLAVLAEYALRNNRPGEALEWARKAREREPELAYAREIFVQSVLAQANRQSTAGELDAARKTVIDAISTHLQDARVMAMLARIEIQADRSAEAEKIIAQVQQAYPKAPLADELRGDLMVHAGKAREAADAYRKAWNLAPADALGQKLSATLMRIAPAEAVVFAQEWQQKQPRSAAPLLLLASEAQARGDAPQAISHYEKALALAPRAVVALNNLAWLYHERGDGRALELASRAYALAPKSAAVADTYGWILFKQGEKQKALEILKQAAELDPKSAEIQEHLKAAGGA